MSEAVLRTVWQDFEAEIDEKRSTFIAAVRRVENEEEALAFVKERRKLHPDARHTVFDLRVKCSPQDRIQKHQKKELEKAVSPM